ncbi:MAG TPA: COX15/CtaA family protein [Dehalococcoidia bacterium]|nr:COX15/CtaA family protein [Dehalococcoidia bacterium]
MLLARRLAIVTVFSTLVLIALGVVVRATGSGLGCPDWPTCFGGVLPPGNKHPVIEMSHRFVASGVGLLAIALAVVCWRHFRHVPLVAYLAAITVPLVGIQGLIGAITVTEELPPEIVATHLLTAFLILSCLVIVAIGIHFHMEAETDGSSGSPEWQIGVAALLSITILAVVVWVGGYMTESGSSTACSGWPLCNGSVIPAADDQEVVHMLHRYFAAAFGVFALGTAWLLWRTSSAPTFARPAAAALVTIFALQVLVGAFNVWYEFPEWLAVSHTVVASLVWTHLTLVASFVFVRSMGAAHSEAAAALGAPV